MTGCLRLNGLLVISDRLFATSVITGELLDADGAHIGLGSRRTTAPVEIAPTAHGIATTIGPVHIDLLGLTVNIPAFSIDPAATLSEYLARLPARNMPSVFRQESVDERTDPPHFLRRHYWSGPYLVRLGLPVRDPKP